MRLFVFIILTVVFAGDQHGHAQPFASRGADSSWTIAYSPAMPPALSALGETHFFDFPTSSNGVHYVTRPAPVVRPGQTITMVFSLEGTGKLLANEGRSPAKVRLYMQRKGDTLTAQEPYKRWWSLAHTELVSGQTFKLSARIEPSRWSSVFGVVGNKAPAEFGDAVANLENSGFTFGGDFAGHGVYVKDGAVRFVLKEFSVGP